MLGCTVGKSKLRIRLPELGTNQSHSLSVSYMSLRLLCIISRATDALYNLSVASIIVLACKIVRTASTALVGLPFLAVNFFPIKSFLAYTLPIYTITTRATINIAGIGNLFLALVTLRTSIAHSCAFADFTSALVRTGAVRQHHHQQSSPPDKFSSRQAGRFAVLGVHLEMTLP
ncbi:hypothetical protein PsorP6_005196 [Peronosclerospora sorghi]|uniref:Uncharacterized protein n=1 Tax=Peronosclerospora sorghi TaxID=230839 RepID=A0ACC0W3N6_9STRA|nr:hypothetical protein PsorP6_005196 [Peronosclerospora sorghi]